MEPPNTRHAAKKRGVSGYVDRLWCTSCRYAVIMTGQTYKILETPVLSHRPELSSGFQVSLRRALAPEIRSYAFRNAVSEILLG